MEKYFKVSAVVDVGCGVQRNLFNEKFDIKIQLFGNSEQLKKREMLVNVVLWYFTILLRLEKM